MKKITRLILCCLSGVWLAGHAAAEELSFEDRVRAFILENPEVIVEALKILSEREAQAALSRKLSEFPELFSERTGLGIGQPDAEIRVIEFFDYRCAPCKAVHPELVSLVEAHSSLRIEMRHLPILSPGSERAARFSLATREVYGDTAYAAVHEDLWSIRGPLNDTGFRKIAEKHALDFDAIAPEMDSDAVSARIGFNRDVAIALEVVGTPAFLSPDSVTIGSTDVDALAEIWLSQ